MDKMLNNYNGLIELVEDMVKDQTGFNDLHWEEVN